MYRDKHRLTEVDMIRSLFYSIGLLSLSLGVSFVIHANMGAGPWDALAVGESRLFHLTIGTCIFLNGCILIGVNAFLLKERPRWLAALSIFLIGQLVDFWLRVTVTVLVPSDLTSQILFVVIGTTLIGLGISIYLQAGLPSSPMDTLMMALHHRFGLNLNHARLLNEAIAITLAIAAGGSIGIGTLIVACTLGSVIHFFYPIIERMYGKLT